MNKNKHKYTEKLISWSVDRDFENFQSWKYQRYPFLDQPLTNIFINIHDHTWVYVHCGYRNDDDILMTQNYGVCTTLCLNKATLS